MKIMATFSKRSPPHTTTPSALTLQQATADPRFHWDFWILMSKSGSVSCGVTVPFSWVLVHTSFCLCPPRICPQACVSSGSSMVGLMVTSSKRAYVIPWSTAPRAPALVAGPCWPVPPQETLKHSTVSVSWGLWVLVHTRFVWALWVSLVDTGFDSKHDFATPTILPGLLLCSWTWGISSKLLQGCEVMLQCWAAAAHSAYFTIPKSLK